VRSCLLSRFAAREAALRAEAEKALAAFPREKWDRLSTRLPLRLRHFQEGASLFQSLALERWNEAMAVHRAALRRRSRAGWHQLRIGVKRFRYVLENFLPHRYAAWEEGLKRMQDLLGEVHDLDLFSAELHRLRPAPDPEILRRWRERIDSERRSRIAAYRDCAKGKHSLWAQWRGQLPDGKRLLATSMARLAASASLLDPDFRRTRQVARLALNLLDGLAALDLHPGFSNADTRRWLEGAALFAAAGRSRGKRGYHKDSAALAGRLAPPPGWSAEEMKILALIVRYHRGAEPGEDHKRLSTLDEPIRRRVMAMSGILRLAHALADSSDPSALRLGVTLLGDVAQVQVSGWPNTPRASARAAAGKHPLEMATGRSFLIRARPAIPMKLPAAPRPSPGSLRGDPGPVMDRRKRDGTG
jgi:hypothetical protein